MIGGHVYTSYSSVALGGFVAAGHGRHLTGMTFKIFLTSKAVNYIAREAVLTSRVDIEH